MPDVYWTDEMVRRLREHIALAEYYDAGDDDTFVMDHLTYNVGYAKYLLKHLESTRKGNK